MTRALVASVVALALAPAAAHAQGSPFAPLPPPPPPEAPDAPQRPANPDDTGLEAWQTIAMLAGGVILMAGIGYAIVADARRRAPVKEPLAPATGRQAPDPHRERAKHRSRRKQKQARAQRKRNR